MVDLLTSGLALLQGLQAWRYRSHQLHDDGRRDIGHDVQGEDYPAEGAPANISNMLSAARVLLKNLLQHSGVNARDRDIGPETRNDQRSQCEPDALFQFRRFREGPEID